MTVHCWPRGLLSPRLLPGHFVVHEGCLTDLDITLVCCVAERRAPRRRGARATLVTRYPREPREPREPLGAEPIGCLIFGLSGVVGEVDCPGRCE
jgi:hypothetical protein